MKYSNDLKVEYKSKELSIRSDNRYLKFRIVPSQLSLWQRLFCNKWHYVCKNVLDYKTEADSINDLLNLMFNHDTAVRFIESHKTYGEICKHINKVYCEAVEHYNKINKRVVWEF